MLWSKESNESDSVYIDLLIDSIHSNSFVTASRKNNEVSVSARVAGNSKVLHNDYEGAMQMYNKSIRFALDNDHLSLAYANRSYCFMKLNLYDRCLIDIQNAIDAHYPESLVPKLEKRKQICLEKLETQTSSTVIESKPKLSYESDCDLPCMASVLKIKANEEFGRLITAECDILIGETLLVEEAYVRVTTSNECYNCANKKMNFLPCPNCVDVMYCGEKCAQNNWHAVECNVLFRSDDSLGIKSSCFVLRSVIIGITAFKTIEDIISSVNSYLSTDPKEITQSFATPESKYHSFFKLSTARFVEQVRGQASSIFHTMMRSESFATKFDTRAKRRFLVHLICHHALILQSNAFGGLCNPPDQVYGNSNQPNESDNDYERNIFLTTSYFNHSCLPNVTKLSKDNLAVVKAIQPIKKGQQLFVTYLAGELIERTSNDRNDELENSNGFRCQCELCLDGVQAGALVLEADSDFQFVVSNVKHFQILHRQIKECCINFLMKYPNNVASLPGYFILNTLTAMLQKELELEK